MNLNSIAKTIILNHQNKRVSLNSNITYIEKLDLSNVVRDIDKYENYDKSNREMNFNKK